MMLSLLLQFVFQFVEDVRNEHKEATHPAAGDTTLLGLEPSNRASQCLTWDWDRGIVQVFHSKNRAPHSA